MIITAERFIEQLEKNKKVSVEGLRNCSTGKIGQVSRQGDVYFHIVPSDWPRGEEIHNYQLAPGAGKGSRHMVDPEFKVYEGVKFPDYVNNRFKTIKACLGPVFVVTNQTKPVTHPEHCNFAFAKDMVIQVTFQANAKTWKRAQD